MDRVSATSLESFAKHAIEAFGADAETAEIVASSLVTADLVGHTSHGCVRLPYYAEQVEGGAVDPTAAPVVESAGEFDQLAGNSAFGQLTGHRAVELLVDGAREHGIGVAGIRDSGHLGRIGEWAERVVEEGFLFVSWVNLQGGSHRIAPPGTAARRLGTNPVTFGVPTFGALPFPLVFDAATSQVAHGKIIERDGSDERLPDAWTITESGDPVERAADFEDGAGALLPLGGRESGYKGFGLAVVAELFAAIVGDGPVATQERQGWAGNGGAFIALDPSSFTSPEDIRTRVESLAAHLRSAEPIGDEPVLLPGEPEHRTAVERRADGIPVEANVGAELRALATHYDLVSELPPSLG
ncbi:Ldh family oxidoreductase [Halomontanus rarus]|uniref:Ldh family oxidoreductase n=1 Tax=Halomontanus rarus TaxID=3034020 RepID=UPI0023E85DD6|nr:Ldh family oxidoreductase [Halovivax sp. TS33]